MRCFAKAMDAGLISTASTLPAVTFWESKKLKAPMPQPNSNTFESFCNPHRTLFLYSKKSGHSHPILFAPVQTRRKRFAAFGFSLQGKINLLLIVWPQQPRPSAWKAQHGFMPISFGVGAAREPVLKNLEECVHRSS